MRTLLLGAALAAASLSPAAAAQEYSWKNLRLEGWHVIDIVTPPGWYGGGVRLILAATKQGRVMVQKGELRARIGFMAVLDSSPCHVGSWMGMGDTSRAHCRWYMAAPWTVQDIDWPCAPDPDWYRYGVHEPMYCDDQPPEGECHRYGFPDLVAITLDVGW